MTPEILYKINLLAKIMFFVTLGLRIVLGAVAKSKPFSDGLKTEYKLKFIKCLFFFGVIWFLTK